MAFDTNLAVEIVTHVTRNLYEDKHVASGGDLILAVQSPPGEGKTYHCKTVLGEMDVKIVRFPVADLESPGAGLPAVRLVESYIAASDAVSGGMPTALLIEDADLGLGSVDHVGEITQFTMNRSLFTGALMGLCDAPTLVNVPNESTLTDRGAQKLCRRVPIIMTGNNLRRSYPALFRDGRARVINWRAAKETKIAYLMAELPEIPEASAASLVEEFTDVPISFWGAILRELRHRHATAEVRAIILNSGKCPSISALGASLANRAIPQPTVAEMHEAAQSHSARLQSWWEG